MIKLIRQRYTPEKVLENWRELLQAIPDMNETELQAALKEEASKPLEERRKDFIERLHRRFTKVRQERELRELMS